MIRIPFSHLWKHMVNVHGNLWTLPSRILFSSPNSRFSSDRCTQASQITLQKWTRELAAIKQYLPFHPLVDMANVLGQLDGGQKVGQDGRLVIVWDENDERKFLDGSVRQLVWLDLTYCSKKSDKVT
jgi:hypothetical protein